MRTFGNLNSGMLWFLFLHIYEESKIRFSHSSCKFGYGWFSLTLSIQYRCTDLKQKHTFYCFCFYAV